MELIDGNQIAAAIIAELKAEIADDFRPKAVHRARARRRGSRFGLLREEEGKDCGGDRRHEPGHPAANFDLSSGALSTHRRPQSATQRVDGILVQSPLPKHIDEVAVFRRVAPEKDVDGFNTINLGKVAQEDETGFVACTPAGIMELLGAKRRGPERQTRRRARPLADCGQADRTARPAEKSRRERAPLRSVIRPPSICRRSRGRRMY